MFNGERQPQVAYAGRERLGMVFGAVVTRCPIARRIGQMLADALLGIGRQLRVAQGFAHDVTLRSTERLRLRGARAARGGSRSRARRSRALE